jgi:hypothetical protein
MSLFNNNKQKGKQGKKDPKSNAQNSKFIVKPSKGATAAQRPHKAGGTRGS